jgi:glycosyltransferase involved in cell wall biosynthesis
MKKDKKRICWITPDYFLETDFHIVPLLSEYYEIEWILINTLNSQNRVIGLVPNNFEPRAFNLKYRQKDPRIIFQYISLLSGISRKNYDMVYISFHGSPFFLPLFFWFINPTKFIYGSHNFSTPLGATHQKIMRIYNNYAFRRFANIHVFSQYQLNLITKKMPDKNICYVPFALKDYGPSIVAPPSDKIRFLFFGYIRDYKRLDLLLNSFQEIYRSGSQNIELLIAGSCENWKKYESRIEFPNAIKTRIELIPNSEIPDIIASCHYMVLPYQDCAQSGILSMSYQYSKPVIASNIEAFDRLIIDGATGYYFENKSEESLTRVMRKVIKNHQENYQTLKENITTEIKSSYQIKETINGYKEFIDDCMNRNRL